MGFFNRWKTRTILGIKKEWALKVVKFMRRNSRRSQITFFSSVELIKDLGNLISFDYLLKHTFFKWNKKKTIKRYKKIRIFLKVKSSISLI